jgi:hypothetical protein
MTAKRTAYQLLKYSNDIKAVRRGRIGRRIGRRLAGNTWSGDPSRTATVCV